MQLQDRSGGGQRYYTSEDLRNFLTIKDLLYNQGYTIAGAKNKLVFDKKETMPAIKYYEEIHGTSAATKTINEQFLIQLKALKQQLINLKKIL